jgi:hypothetical protein
MTPDTNDHMLSDADREALDALMETGLDAASVSEALRARAGRVTDLLSLAAGPRVDPPARLAEGVLARIAATGSVAPTFATSPGIGPKLALTTDVDEPDLVPDDEEAIDAYVTAGYRPEKVSSSLRERAVRIDRLGALITAGHVAASPDLAARTLAAVRNARLVTPVQISGGSRGGFRFADLISIAAALVLGVSVLWPVLATYRVHASRAACAANMAALSTGFGQYAGDHRDAMPMAAASLGGASWWNVGTSPDRSNSANLFQLSRNHYVKHSDLACAGNARADRAEVCVSKQDWDCLDSVSYSYHLMFGNERPRWGERTAIGPMVILADKSPVVARAVRGEDINPFENSPNHRGDGQWGLRTDGSAVWLSSPQLGDDNIWLPGIIDAMLNKAREEIAKGTPIKDIRINGDELPISRSDTFVGP